jgi:hypothetical protein
VQVEYALSNRDPRRNKPLLDWILSLTLDHRSADPFAQGKVGFRTSVSVACRSSS